MNLIKLDEEAIFHIARDIGSATARCAYLDQVCGDDRRLRGRVDALVMLYEQETGFLESPAQSPLATVPVAGVPHPPEGPGAVIGPYRLLEPIGEGGMGTVYLAEQDEPVRRRVALKVIKPGMDSKQVLARFEAERQALAMMDHPNIAKVHDAGATPSGRPYFVMELVCGPSITDYCDQQRLSIPERLQLFVLVCRALQHAHQKGVIHRDLKPSNILVTVIDGVAVPKVIDFGIAKTTGGQLTEKSIHAGFAQLIGTPLYMSPEQAGLSGVDVDTRSDIYALGVLLYELLTGTTPIDRETLCKAAYDEICRVIREQDPPTPSTRLGALGETLSAVSANRHSDARKLGHAVRGELDWIVMKALEKDRSRRYETANDFAADVMRHLTDRPVEACPPSVRYRFAKYARRNRAALTAALLVGLTLVAGTAVSAWQAKKARAAAAEAQLRANESKQVIDYLTRDIFGASVAGEGHSRSVTIGELIDQADATLADRFRGQPLVEASVRLALAETNQRLVEWGHQKRAVQNATRAVELRTRSFGPEHPETLSALAQLAIILSGVGRSNRRSNLEAGAEIARRVFAARRRVLGPAQAETLEAQALLADLLHQLGRSEEALAYGSQAEALAVPVLGPDHPTTLAVWQIVGLIVAERGDFERGSALLRRAVAGCERILGPHEPRTIDALHGLAILLRERGQLDEARQLYSEVVGRTGEVHGFSSIQSSSAIRGLFDVLDRQHDYAAIRDLCRCWLRDILATPAPADLFQRYRRSVGLGNLAVSLITLPDRDPFDADLAMRAVEEAVALNPSAYVDLARVCARLGRLDLARQRVPELTRRIAGNPSAINNLAWCLATCDSPELRDPARAVELARMAVEKAPRASSYWNTLGVALYLAGDWEAAIGSLEKSEALEPDDEDVVSNLLVLALAHWQLGEKDQAHRWYDKARTAIDGEMGLGDAPRCLIDEAKALLGVEAQ